MSEEMLPHRQLDFYQEMRSSIRAWLSTEGHNYRFADYLLAVPDLFHLLCRLAIDRDVEVSEKAALAAAIVYIVSPIDFLPEALTGPVGYIDDLVVAALALDLLVNKTPSEIVTRHWAGDGDVLDLIQQILCFAEEMIGTGLWERIQKHFGRKAEPEKASD